jgi:hypothetical protein
MRIHKGQFGEVGPACVQVLTQADARRLLVVFKADRGSFVEELEEAAVAVQRLAERTAGDHRVAHHVPGAERDGARGVAQGFIAHGQHGLGLQVGELLHADARLWLTEEARRDALPAQQGRGSMPACNVWRRTARRKCTDTEILSLSRAPRG